MTWRQEVLVVATRGRGFYDLRPQLRLVLAGGGLRIGLCHLFLRHTSASLCITENADPDVHADLERFAGRLAPDGAAWFAHDDEGADDMPAHVRSVVAGYELTVPITDGELQLGVWQGIYVWEHRLKPHRREIVVSLNGTA